MVFVGQVSFFIKHHFHLVVAKSAGEMTSRPFFKPSPDGAK
jgi:hypothetical protein